MVVVANVLMVVFFCVYASDSSDGGTTGNDAVYGKGIKVDSGSSSDAGGHGLVGVQYQYTLVLVLLMSVVLLTKMVYVHPGVGGADVCSFIDGVTTA